MRPLQQNGYANTLRERLHALATLGVTPDRIYVFVIAKGATDEPVGSIGLWQHKIGPGRASIGYWVLDAHRRRRVASCALSAIATWGFTLPGIARLELYVEPWNEGSWRTAEHAGFYREGLLRSWESVGDQRRDMYMYSRLATDPT